MLKELEDYNWFPAELRLWQMEFIGFIVCILKLYKPVVPVLNRLAATNNIAVIQDLCSGSGEPAVWVAKRLTSSIPSLLTDKFPNPRFKNRPGLIYADRSVDLLQLQPQSGNLYTMYNAWHHFTTAQQQQIVSAMAKSQTPFLFAEIIEPGILSYIRVIFSVTIMQLLLAPFVYPFSLRRLLCTYIIPINLITITWDGIISIRRSCSVREYKKRLEAISTSAYAVQVNRVKTFAGHIIYISGSPIK